MKYDGLSILLASLFVVGVIVLFAMIIRILPYMCWYSDWQCKADVYEQRVAECMTMERLTLTECRLLASD